MATETNYNRPKKNYQIAKRRKDKQRREVHGTPTVSYKVDRQRKLLARKQKKREEKKLAKESKMQTD